MNEKELLLRFFQVVAYGLRHEHYNHTKNKSKLYMQLVAGVGLDDLLKRYVRREQEALFKQRVELTEHIVTAVCKNLLDVFYKVPRSNSARRTIATQDENGKKKVKDLEDILKKFWGDSSFDEYMSQRWIELNSVDPNAFVVFEWDDFDAKRTAIQPRPYEVFSKNAIDYKYQNRSLQYLIVSDNHNFKVHKQPTVNTEELPNPKNGYKKGTKYTLYGPKRTWQLLQMDELAIEQAVELTQGVVGKAVVGGQQINVVKLGKIVYEYKEFKPHNVGHVPAFRVGYYRDLATNGETYVNPLHSVEPFLKKTIKTNSEFDLVATLLALPQQIKYGQPCEDTKCYGGQYEDGSDCPTCGGTGVKKTAPSAQDSIVIPMPRDKDQMIPLGDILKYVHPPVDIVKWQEEYIDKLTDKCKQIMFNQDIYTKRQVAETAHGRNIDMQNVYDTLYPFATMFCKLWEFGVKTTAILADRNKNMLIRYTFGKDFKLKSLDTLIMDASIANGIGNATLLSQINNDIADIIFSEKQAELSRYKLQEFYNPFSGKSEKEIAVLMFSDLVSRKDKILYANFSRIFDELELDYAALKSDFYKLTRTKQRDEIYRKVDEIIDQIASEAPPPQLDLGE